MRTETEKRELLISMIRANPMHIIYPLKLEDLYSHALLILLGKMQEATMKLYGFEVGDRVVTKPLVAGDHIATVIQPSIQSPYYMLTIQYDDGSNESCRPEDLVKVEDLNHAE